MNKDQKADDHFLKQIWGFIVLYWTLPTHLLACALNTHNEAQIEMFAWAVNYFRYA